jgi:uncharacterized protein
VNAKAAVDGKKRVNGLHVCLQIEQAPHRHGSDTSATGLACDQFARLVGVGRATVTRWVEFDVIRFCSILFDGPLRHGVCIDKINTFLRMRRMDIYFSLGGDTFVWNAAKAKGNLSKHGVRFEEAASVFADPFFVLMDASRNEEARDAAIGFDAAGRLLFVVHIELDGVCIRIISARRATPGEEESYVV